jgi:hypothetical protein
MMRCLDPRFRYGFYGLESKAAVADLNGEARADRVDEVSIPSLLMSLAFGGAKLTLLGASCAAAPAAGEGDTKREGEKASSWLNGTNRQPASLLGAGPVTFSIHADAYYAWQFQHPIDHTIFPTTTAPRHNEISLNSCGLNLELKE